MSELPTLEQVQTLRELFEKKCEKEPAPCGSFHPNDLNRIKTNNFYLEKFLEHNDLDMKLSLQMVWDVCNWRKNYGANEINESNIRMDYLNQGIIFPHNKDKDGKSLLIFKLKLHTKGSKDIKELMRVVVYWVERMLSENDLDKITVFFDMQGTSVGNVDMDFIKRIIETLKLYPLPLNYILIYEMPWILNAGFKIIKGLLPPKAVAIMKFVNQKNISEYIDAENALASWGGKDKYVFSFQPAQQKPKKSMLSSHTETSLNNNDDDFELSPSTKKVHFANSSPMYFKANDGEKQETPNDDEMLKISPCDIIIPNKEGESSDVFITNISKFPVTYKIKTTAPQKFRVRPSSGVVGPNGTTIVSVVLQPGKKVSEASKDKFLVMCTALPEGIDQNSYELIADFWKTLPPNSPNVQQHRLQCVNSVPAQGDQMHNGHMPASGSYVDDFGDRKNSANMDVAQLSDSLKRLEQQMRLSVNLHWLSLLVFVILSIALTYIIKQEIQEQQNSSTCDRNSRY